MRFGFWVQGCLGNYQIEGNLGRGGFGKVFRAVGSDARKVAIKYLADDLDEDARKRFNREMVILQGFRHPNVIELVDYGVDEQGRAWYAMPEMSGGTLAQLVEQERTWEQVLEIVLQVASGLTAYHALDPNAVHRDVKLENVLLDGQGHAKLADFGVARCPELTGSSLTRNANGTAPYMAPEVWKGQGSQASDIYALGILFWELVNGERHTMPARPPKLLNAGPQFEPMENLYQSMTQVDWRKRPTAEVVVHQLDQFIAYLQRAPQAAVEKKAFNWGEALPWILGGVAVVGGLIALASALDDDRRA